MTILPKDFLKSRRPEQFSDSGIESETYIDRLALEGYLSTLSNRSQELEFEGFAKSLCQVEICPNLLPHTGPTGGGDSKVDSETYPVSEITSLNWFVGQANIAATERWAFAFSIQKTWLEKVKADIEKLCKTRRTYTVAYFVSNQYIPDKKRAETEDLLRAKHGIDVRILDRNWIMDKIFRNKREDIVEKELHIEIKRKDEIKKGHDDLKKEEKITELNKKIEEKIKDGELNNALVEDAIKSAILSREIEKPRVEVDGYFERAVRLAVQFGTQHSKFEVIYQYAWTSFWWHEDYSTFANLYVQVEAEALKTENVYNFERLSTLWIILRALKSQNEKLIDDVAFSNYTKNIKEKLTKLAQCHEDRPSAALYAKSLLLEIELYEKVTLHENFDQTLIDLRDVVKHSEGLVGFPLKPVIKVLTEIGSELESSTEYQELFDSLLEVTERREGEIASANLRLKRSKNLIEQNLFYEAIQQLGIAIPKLYKNESKDQVVRALFLMSIAYEEVGLLWAARGSLLSAASLATSDYWNYGEINKMQAACYKRLKSIELKLGRLPQMLDWHLLDVSINDILTQKGLKIEDSSESVNTFDFTLGAILLRSNLDTLKTLETIPNTLENLRLDISSAALLYALGHVEKICSEFFEVIKKDEVDDFFNKMSNKLSSEFEPISGAESNVTLRSRILGCSIIVNCENQSPCVELAESILSAIECFLSTSMLTRAVAHESEIEIIIDSSATENLIEFAFVVTGSRPVFVVRCSKMNPHALSRTDQVIVKDTILDMLIQIISNFVMFKDPEQDLAQLFRDERVLDRSLSFSGSFITLGNLLGHEPKFHISDWIDKKNERYELLRSEPLNFSEDPITDEVVAGSEDLTLEHAKHTDIQTVSIIRKALWDQAKWSGVGYLCVPEEPPVFAIIFDDIIAGKEIFKEWRERIGSYDYDGEIKITVITDIDIKKPFHYKIGISAGIKTLEKQRSDSRFVVSTTRIHVMTPSSNKNIENFRSSYNKNGYYLFAPASLGKDGLLDIVFELGIVKQDFCIKKASDIEKNGIDSAMID